MADSSSTSGMSSNAGSNNAASSEDIRQAQQALQSQGLYRGPVDGKWGPETRNAVAQFQKQKGLKQTAQLDQPTLSGLQNGATGGSDNMSSSPSGGTTSGGAMRGNGTSSPQINPGNDAGTSMPAH
jgi:peptidoglycan hydrolase-like protein with peptidoglycan-binding domain